MKTIKGMLVYVCIDKPRDCFDKEKGQEWKATVVTADEDTADLFAETFAKQPPKKIKTTDFEGIYKVAPPEGAGKNVWAITLRKNTLLSNGDPVPSQYQPKAFVRNEDGTLREITKEVLIANGSMGEVSLDIFESKKYGGKTARLKNILVTELIEYEGGDRGGEAGSEFGEVAPAPAPAKAAAKPAAKVKPAPKAEELEDDEPF